MRTKFRTKKVICKRGFATEGRVIAEGTILDEHDEFVERFPDAFEEAEPKGKRVEARFSFAVDGRVVQEGEEFPADDAFVLAHAQNFGRPKRRRGEWLVVDGQEFVMLDRDGEQLVVRAGSCWPTDSEPVKTYPDRFIEISATDEARAERAAELGLRDHRRRVADVERRDELEAAAEARERERLKREIAARREGEKARRRFWDMSPAEREREAASS